MKQKGIKRLLFYLIPLMLAFFSLSIIIATVRPTVADSVESNSSTYPFKTGINAFEYAWELTVPETTTDGHTNILYKPDSATEEDPCFPALNMQDGYLALHVQTDKKVQVFFNLYDVDDTLPAYSFKGTPYFMSVNELTGVVTTNSLDIKEDVITIPAASRGAIILNLSGFLGQESSTNKLSTVELFTMHVMDTGVNAENAGATVKFGTLGYYESKMATEMNVLTTAELWSGWKIATNTVGVSLTQIPSSFEKGVNEFAYGYNAVFNSEYTPENEQADWRKICYNVDNSAFATPNAEQVGYFALQIETKNALSIYPSLYDGKKEIYYDCENKAPMYFAKESGEVTKLTCNDTTDHVDIPAGSKGALIIPATSFVDADLNWGNITTFVLNINRTTNPNEIDVNLGELGYYETQVSNITKVTTLDSQAQADSTKIWSVGITLTKIQYIGNEMEKGDNAFAYGALWSGVTETENESSWSRVLIKFDKPIEMDKQNGILAIQMEIECEGELSFLPSLWDGDETSQSSQSFFLGTATFITEDGVSTAYETVEVEEKLNENEVLKDTYLQISKSTGVLLMRLADFDDNTDTNWSEVTSALITVNTINAYGFKLKIGEIGYYSTNVSDDKVAMEKLSVLADVEDFNRYSVFNTQEPTATGTLDRIANLDTPPAARYASVSTAGDVGLIFYVEFPSVDPNAGFIGEVTIDNVEGSQSLKGIYNEEKGCFAFIASILPKYYDRNVTLTISYEGHDYAFTTSVKKYAEKLISISAPESDIVNLANALLTYCKAAKNYFDDNGSETTNATITGDDKTNVANFKAVLTDNENDITVNGATLCIESRTSIKVYFTTEKALQDIEVSVTVNQAPAPYVRVSKAEVDLDKNGVIDENCYVVSIGNIVAKDLDNMYEITIGTKQVVEGEEVVSDTDTVVYSALSYVNAIVNPTSDTEADISDKLFNVAVALYYYNVAANNYFASK